MPTTPPILPDTRLVLTTAAAPDEARRLARTLVEEHLAACVTLVPEVESFYRWDEKIESSAETLLLIKTATDQLPALQSRLHALHSYELPEFLVFEVDAESSSHPYLEWLLASLRKP
jgi:periplasmic divalent cation tolerance protein